MQDRRLAINVLARLKELVEWLEKEIEAGEATRLLSIEPREALIFGRVMRRFQREPDKVFTVRDMQVFIKSELTSSELKRLLDKAVVAGKLTASEPEYRGAGRPVKRLYQAASKQSASETNIPC